MITFYCAQMRESCITGKVSQILFSAKRVDSCFGIVPLVMIFNKEDSDIPFALCHLEHSVEKSVIFEILLS
jgi:hypothetical protein